MTDPTGVLGVDELALLRVVHAHGDIVTRCSATADGFEDKFDALRDTTPGQTAEILLGSNWRLHSEEALAIPDEHRSEPGVLHYHTIIVVNTDDVMVACRSRVYELLVNVPSLSAYRWEDLTPTQRANRILSDMWVAVLGVGPDGLLTALAAEVAEPTYGTDPSNWIHAAQRLIDDARHPDADPSTREQVEAALFLARLASPRFARLIERP